MSLDFLSRVLELLNQLDEKKRKFESLKDIKALRELEPLYSLRAKLVEAENRGDRRRQTVVLDRLADRLERFFQRNRHHETWVIDGTNKSVSRFCGSGRSRRGKT